jgi:hypothetical protein
MAAIGQLVVVGILMVVRAIDPVSMAASCLLSLGIGMYLMRWWAHRELARIASERDECWDYANRLLESPEFYSIERGCLDGAGVPRYGLFGRIVEPEGDLWPV